MTISPTVRRHPDHDDECVAGTRCVGFRCCPRSFALDCRQ
jgi:hypothetical protein